MSETPAERTALTSRYIDAFQLAFDVHRHQVRKGSGVPYLTHVMSVSALVLEASGDEDCAIGGLLHDAVEDSDDGEAMLVRIHDQFGPRVAGIVESCSDAIGTPGGQKPHWRPRKERYIAHLAHDGPDALLVSACDKLHNARSIVADLHAVGPVLWQRFTTRSAADQLWYYQSLSDVFTQRGDAAVAGALREAVDEMTALAGAQGEATQEQLAWAAHSGSASPGA